jgi:hypothetical protein
MFLGGQSGPFSVHLKDGEIVWKDPTTVSIGKFIRCDLKQKSWRLSITVPALHYDAFASGTFEYQRDGSWLASLKSGGIT